MKKIFIAVAGFLLFACAEKAVQTNSTSSHNFTSRSLASEEMQDVMLPETMYNEKANKDVNCALATQLNKIQDKNKRFEILAKEASAIQATAYMILSSDEGHYSCDEARMLQEKTYDLTERSLCFELAVGKYYNLQAMKKHADYAKYQKAYADKLKSADVIQKFNTPLSSKCNPPDYVSDFKSSPLETVIPLCSFFSN